MGRSGSKKEEEAALLRTLQHSSNSSNSNNKNSGLKGPDCSISDNHNYNHKALPHTLQHTTTAHAHNN